MTRRDPSPHGGKDTAPAPEASVAARQTIRQREIRSFVISIVVMAGAGLVTTTVWWTALVAIPSLALSTALLFRDWDRPPNPLLLAGSGLLGVLALVVTSLTYSNFTGSTGLAITAGVWIAHRPRDRLVLTLLACLGIAALTWATALLSGNSGGVYQLVVMMSITGSVWIVALVESHTQDRLFDLLEREKDHERELSILRERNRFAADLHDIQGHTLHVIKLKAAVAAKLQHTDPERTRQELEVIQRLVADTIGQARQLANSTHALVFSTELSNAVELFRAAGITTRVDRTEDDPGPHEAHFALALREATTNVLRHARPGEVTITSSADTLSVRNDGADIKDAAPLRGLATLADRVRAVGGTLTADRDGGVHTLTVTFPTEAR
ncbi:sensor histidine kinase [Actinoalloteichus caeruleus]|uniref:Two-component system, NarL family, sensor histidine kinase DesK n=1 Tax=Actinoalloteichus caeruleus DSM 43889 TaxID=1120930 RepID=A0ABT1JD88_ACTCY|nr:histidine kinase [Actinoalloteichus caeruleus]MCP2330244.1 two-component system, NarL family, sensor histidine kinase DesK [Actinoalloteichus caeruleus DSM 43889]